MFYLDATIHIVNAQNADAEKGEYIKVCYSIRKSGSIIHYSCFLYLYIQKLLKNYVNLAVFATNRALKIKRAFFQTVL
jgi:hypothetical protein